MAYQFISHKINEASGTITYRFVGLCTEQQKNSLENLSFYNETRRDIYGRPTSNKLNFFISPKNKRLYLEFFTTSGNVANAQNQMKVFFNHFKQLTIKEKISKLEKQLKQTVIVFEGPPKY